MFKPKQKHEEEEDEVLVGEDEVEEVLVEVEDDIKEDETLGVRAAQEEEVMDIERGKFSILYKIR